MIVLDEQHRLKKSNQTVIDKAAQDIEGIGIEFPNLFRICFFYI